VNDALTGTVAAVVGAAGVTGFDEPRVHRVAMGRLQVPAGLIGSFVEAERLRAERGVADSGQISLVRAAGVS